MQDVRCHVNFGVKRCGQCRLPISNPIDGVVNRTNLHVAQGNPMAFLVEKGGGRAIWAGPGGGRARCWTCSRTRSTSAAPSSWAPRATSTASRRSTRRPPDQAAAGMAACIFETECTPCASKGEVCPVHLSATAVLLPMRLACRCESCPNELQQWCPACSRRWRAPAQSGNQVQAAILVLWRSPYWLTCSTHQAALQSWEDCLCAAGIKVLACPSAGCCPDPSCGHHIW